MKMGKRTEKEQEGRTEEEQTILNEKGAVRNEWCMTKREKKGENKQAEKGKEGINVICTKIKRDPRVRTPVLASSSSYSSQDDDVDRLFQSYLVIPVDHCD